MKKNLTIIAVSVMMVIAGCGGNPNPKNIPQDGGTQTEQVSEELETAVDSVAVAMDSAKQAIEESTDQLNQLLNDLNK
ncbi:MAG TPA: hypothetical protein PK711_05420 [Bacteroidales bacterium]|nr:hypothetical protein [Bacteroidales bacterium]HRZ20294.1 hypothetical protein [Bacteroidales bacterium]